jgi:hypothetical protein
MIAWLLYQVPWWVWALLGLAVVGAIQRAIGWRNAIAAAAVIGAALFGHRSRQRGYQDRQAQEEKASDTLEEYYREIDNRPRDPGDAYERLHQRSRDR